MNRVMVLGSAGSGKSTLSQNLGMIFNLPIIHLDMYFWKSNWVMTPDEEWDQIVNDFALQEQWIIDGNYSRTIDLRIERADLIIYLDMPRWLCLLRVLKRRIMYHNRTRPDMNEGCPEKIDFEFLKWIWNYRKRSRMKTIKKLEQVRGIKEVVILKNQKQVNDYMQRF